MGYDAVKIVTAALKNCGMNSQCVKDELYREKDFQGASAVIGFNEKGDVVKPFVPMTIRDGEFVKFE